MPTNKPRSIVTYVHRYERPARKRKAQPVTLTGPAIVRAKVPAGAEANSLLSRENTGAEPPAANADRKPSIVTTTSRKQAKQLRAERGQRAPGTDDAADVSPEVTAFFARMVRPGGALPPKRR